MCKDIISKYNLRQLLLRDEFNKTAHKIAIEHNNYEIGKLIKDRKYELENINNNNTYRYENRYSGNNRRYQRNRNTQHRGGYYWQLKQK